uniref:Uncharacterized protein n=1 Tax=Glossina pallidipes TaxID=7398 RepID=A0A1A9ZAF5_GLOPL
MHFDQAGREPGYVTPNTQKTKFSSNTRCVHLYICVRANSLYLFCDFRVDFIFSSPCYVSHALVAAFVVDSTQPFEEETGPLVTWLESITISIVSSIYGNRTETENRINRKPSSLHQCNKSNEDLVLTMRSFSKKEIIEKSPIPLGGSYF